MAGSSLSKSMVRVALVAGLSLTLSAHYTWLGWDVSAWRAGATVEVKLGHGHKFPVSEETASRRNLEAFAVAPTGKKTPLSFQPADKALSAKVTVSEPGAWVLYLSQDFGLRSRTPQGMKPGGRQENPTATEVVRSYRSAIAYAGDSQFAQKPLGLPFELSGLRHGVHLELTLTRDGKPLPGVPVTVFAGGRESDAGTTDSAGRVVWDASSVGKGQVLFAVDWTDKPAGGSYDRGLWSTSLSIQL